MFHRFKRVAFSLAIMAGAASWASGPADPNVPPTATIGPSKTYTLIVDVENVRNSNGTIDMLVFNQPKGWPDELPFSLNKQEVKAEQGRVILKVEGLPEGDYAVLAMHDENFNRRIDKDWRGIPKEQWGMSNNPRAVLNTPAYERAKFHIGSDTEIHISLKLYP